MRYKNLFSILITGILIIAFSVVSFKAVEFKEYSIIDATFIQKCIVELEEPTDEQIRNFDFNSNGVLDITDATYIMYKIAEIEPPQSTTPDENPTEASTTTAQPTTEAITESTAATEPSTLAGPQYLYFDEDEIILVEGESYELSVICDKGNSYLTYATDNKSIVTVNNNGVLTAVSAGTAIVTVSSDNGLSDSCPVTVIAAPQKVNLNLTNKTCKVGDTFNLMANTDTTSYPYEYIWKSSNPYIATVTRSGDDSANVTIKSQGSAYITVETFNGKTAICNITVSGSNVKCIDVSSWQGDIDFNKVKATGIDYVILRAGFGRETYQKDNRFEEYYDAAKKAGLKIGVYWFSYATTPEEGVDEANACLYCLGNKELDMPVYYDMEYEPALFGLSKEENTAMAKYFCEAIKKAGYDTGVYSSASAYTYNLNMAALQEMGYSIWYAHWTNECEVNCDIWQYDSETGISGINTDVDCNYIFNLNIIK